MPRQRKWWHPYPGTFRPVWAAAQATERSTHTIHTWIKQGKLTTVCDIRTRELLIDLKEAATLNKQTDRRKRALKVPNPNVDATVLVNELRKTLPGDTTALEHHRPQSDNRGRHTTTA